MTFCVGHWLSTHATSDPTWQSDVAKLQRIEKVVDKIQPGPIRCLYGPSPLIQPICFFSFNLGKLNGPSPTDVYFLSHNLSQSTFFWASTFSSPLVSFLLFFFILKQVPIVKWEPITRIVVWVPHASSIFVQLDNLIQRANKA